MGQSLSKRTSSTRKLIIPRRQVSLTLCLEACAKGEISLVQEYLKSGGDVNKKEIKNGKVRTPLLRASYHGHVEIVKKLHEYGAQVDLQNNDGWSALMAASEPGNCDVVKLLHEYGAQVDLQNNKGSAALMIASENGHCEVVKLLHECGARVDLKNNKGWSALMKASQNGRYDVVKLLHEYGAQVDVQNNNGSTALMIASQDGHGQVVKLLHEYGAQVDLQNNNGSTALMKASQNGHYEVVKLLHEYGAQVDLQKKRGFTALSLAEKRGQTDVINFLQSILHIQKEKYNKNVHPSIAMEGGHVNNLKVASQYGDIEKVAFMLSSSLYLSQEEIVEALLLASQNGHSNIVKVIIQRCGHVNSTDEKGRSALIVASQHGHSEVVKTLIDHGAEVDVQDKNGMSPLMCASQNGHKDVLRILLRKEPQVNLKNSEGWTALMFASWNCHIDTVEGLFKAGAYVERDFVSKLSSLKHLTIVSILIKQIDIDEVEKRHLAAVQKAIEQQGALTHTTVHGVIVGLARSGKDSLMKRFLGEMPSGKSPSTGVAEKAIQVRVERSSTIAANVEDSKWTRLTEYDDEAMEMMTQLTAKQGQLRIKKEASPSEQRHSKEKTPDSKVKKVETLESSFSLAQMKKQALKYHVQPSTVDIESNEGSAGHQKKRSIVAHKLPLNVFKDALKSKGLTGLREHLENHWSLYLSNTGGQMEFQELLPLLVSGPSMIFVTFRLDRELNKLYDIKYEVVASADKSSKSKSFKYMSSATPLETILQTLATFDGVGTFEYSNQQRERVALTYKVFIIGTHRDILEKKYGKEVGPKIKEIDKEIQQVVKHATYYQHIEFATEDQMIFTVNNFSESDSDFQHIRSSVQRVIDTGDFRMTTPSHWLIYSLVLRQLKSCIESYDECFRIARDCGITSHEEHKEALHFIHTKMGLIRYFPQDELDQIVFLDPQTLFDKVTDLITNTFTFEKAGKHLKEDFKRGLFIFSDLEKLQCTDSLLTPYQLTKVLEHLHIAAPFHQDGVLKYFLPCAIPHADKPQKEFTQTSQLIPPLVVSFECGYRPMGLAGALITYLMTNEGQHRDFKWNLLPDEIFRDQVSFVIEPSCDTINFRIFSTHLEVTICPDPNDTKRICCPIEKICHEVWSTIQAGIEKVNSDINYIKNIEPIFTFYCQVESCKGTKFHHVKLFPGKLFCPRSNLSCQLPVGHEKWMLQDIPQEKVEATGGRDVICNSSHHAVLLSQLKLHAAKWREVGTYLGFHQGELDTIASKPNLQQQAPKSWLSAMLAEWLEWAPSDERGSKSYATLSGLKSALRELV